ncbi:MAG: carboxypeptidase-like regulatory domain-containing protein, partial [Flavobacteriales bacterium]
ATAKAQQVVQGRDVEASTQEPLASVHVLDEGAREGATTDIDGRFVLRLAGTQATVRFSYVGYAPHTEMLSVGPPAVVRMQRTAVELRTVEVLPGENPAHRIIQRVYAARKENDGLRNRPHRYTSYSKSVFTGDVDSALMRDPSRIAALDSNDREAIEFMQRQHILLMESATRKS